jgi:hypothetical protein
MRRAIFATLLLIFLPGCTYYEITDPTSGRRYVTNSWNMSHTGVSGAIEFKDFCTDANVTLQSSEQREITSDQADIDERQDGAFTKGAEQTPKSSPDPSGPQE